MRVQRLMALTALLLAGPAARAAQPWKPAPSPLMTRWGRKVSPKNVLPEYPRPQMVRQEWMNLNGLWEFAVGKTALFTTTGGIGDREETAQLALAAGLHRLEACWRQTRDGYYSLDCPINIEGPGLANQPIPAAWLQHQTL